MRKLFTILITAVVIAVSCHHEDIWNELRDHEERIQKLETLCNKLNSNVEAIQMILTALEKNDYITDLVKVMEDGIEVGYCITFAKGGPVTIYHGTNGTDGAAPKVSIRKAADGEYYWTADGEWMTDENGERIPAVVADDPAGEYVTPQFRVADGKWYVSYDNGNSWKEIDYKNGGGDEFFQNVTYDQDYVYITVADGNIFKIPYKTDSKVVDLFIFMGQSNMSGRGVAAEAPKVPEGWGFEYKAISDPGKLLHMVEPFGLNEDNGSSGVDDRTGGGTKRKGSSVSALTIAYYEKTGVPVVGVSCSKGGTSTTFWKVGGKPLNDAIERQLAAEQWLADNGYTIRNNYMFWLQGESDRSMAPETYKSNLIAIVKEMIEKTGVTNCMMLRVGQSDTSTATTKNNIIEVQTELCQTYTEFVMASTLTAGFPDDGLMKDTWHYTQEGYDILGTDAGKNVAFYVNNGIEPTMYDPYYQGLYYPISKYKSIFDDVVIPAAYTPHIELGALSTLGVWAKNFYDRQYYRTPRYMQVTDSNVEIKVKDDCDVRVCQYDADFKFIKIIDFTQVMASEGKTFKLDASCEYIRLVFRKDSSLPQFEQPEVYVKNVEAKEYFEPRPADDGYQKILAHVEVDGQILPDYGVVCLPETYSNVGEPTRLIIFCHGAAVNYPSSVSRFVASDINPEYWLKEGYAIMDIEGNPFDNTNEHFYIPQAIQCYKAAYDWVTTTYNIRTDGVFLGGRSMGGGMCFEILRSDIPVIAACPVVPACNQLWYWNYADAGRKKFCSEKMGFTGTQPAWTSSKKLTDAEYDYLYYNFDRMLACSPFWSGIENLPSKDELFSVGRVSANVAYDEAEADLYSTLKFKAKAPVKIFTCYEDNTVPYQRNAQLMYNMMVNAGMECELSLVHTDASTPHRYEQQDSNANITVTTRYGETMSAPWVYVDMVEFWRRYE